jgi:hypothetical protein
LPEDTQPATDQNLISSLSDLQVLSHSCSLPWKTHSQAFNKQRQSL